MTESFCNSMNIIDNLQKVLSDTSYLDDGFINEARSRMKSYEKFRGRCDSEVGQKRITLYPEDEQRFKCFTNV